MEDQPHAMAENVTLEVKTEQHTVGITAIDTEERSEEQSEYIAVKRAKATKTRS